MKKKLPPLILPPKRRDKTFLFLLIALLSCFYGWIILTTLFPPLPQPHQPPILYSNQCRQDLRMTLLRAIKNAQHSIHLVMFNLTEPSLLEALKRKFSEVDVKIYLDPKSPSQNVIKDQITPVKSKGLMHQKILVLDDKMVFIGSANMTGSSLRMDDNLTVGMYSPEVAHFLQEKTPFLSGHLRCRVGGQDLEIWLLPDMQKKALYSLTELLRNAKKEIVLSMFTLTHSQLVDELIAAHKRKVKVKVVVDMRSAYGASAKALEKLQRERVPLLISQGNKTFHYKHLYIDQRILVCGSTNWTQAAFSSNRDCLLILHNLTPSQKKFMNSLEKSILTESKKPS